MLQFYLDMLSRIPRLAWGSLVTFEGAVGVVACILVYFVGHTAADRFTKWHLSKRKWAGLAIGLYFLMLLLQSNYAAFEDAQSKGATDVAELNHRLDDSNASLKSYRVEMEKLAIQNVELMRGAPILTGKAAQAAELRTQLLKYADAAPSQDTFTKEKGDVWAKAVGRFAEDMRLTDEGHRKVYIYTSMYDNSYESLQQVVASVRAAAVSIGEKDIPD
jgi:hypothetical protein